MVISFLVDDDARKHPKGASRSSSRGSTGRSTSRSPSPQAAGGGGTGGGLYSETFEHLGVKSGEDWSCDFIDFASDTSAFKIEDFLKCFVTPLLSTKCKDELTPRQLLIDLCDDYSRRKLKGKKDGFYDLARLKEERAHWKAGTKVLTRIENAGWGYFVLQPKNDLRVTFLVHFDRFCVYFLKAFESTHKPSDDYLPNLSKRIEDLL